MISAELSAALSRLAKTTAQIDAAEGGHRHAGEVARLLWVVASARRDATPAQHDAILALLESWREDPPPAAEMSAAIERCMREDITGETQE